MALFFSNFRLFSFLSVALLSCALWPADLVFAQDPLLEPPPGETMPEPLVQDAPPQPAPQELVAPSPEAAPPAGVPADTAALPEQDVPEIPALPVKEDPDENLFFDAESLVPAGEMGTNAGPSKVNPRLQPGSKLIVVKKNHEAGSQKAQLVSAERAVKLGRYDSALEMYDRLYAENKRDPNVLLGRATTLQHLGQVDLAIQAYEELLVLRPDNIEAQVNMMGLMGRKYPAVALQRLMDLRDKNQNNPGISAQIAVVQAELGHYDEALQYLGVAASMEPRNAGHVFNMAVIADRAGAKAEAVKYYEQALEIDTIYGGGSSIPRESVFERLAQLR